MSTIDKSLPNVEQEIKLPSEEEIAEASQDNIEEQVGPEDVKLNKTKTVVLQSLLILKL
jgi:hypothetical protein